MTSDEEEEEESSVVPKLDSTLGFVPFRFRPKPTSRRNRKPTPTPKNDVQGREPSTEKKIFVSDRKKSQKFLVSDLTLFLKLGDAFLVQALKRTWRKR